MIGHAVSNIVPVVAANRIGVEEGQSFYGSSFVADTRGDKIANVWAVHEARSMHALNGRKPKRIAIFCERLSPSRAAALPTEHGMARFRRNRTYREAIRYAVRHMAPAIRTPMTATSAEATAASLHP